MRWFQVVAWAVTFSACGYPPLSDIVDAGTNDTGPSPEFLSCIALPTTCGASGNDSCCNSPQVPRGSFDRSFDVAGDGASGNPSSPATVSPFRLDKYEVTVGRFRAFVDAGMGTQSNPPEAGTGAHANIAGSGWDTSWNASLATDTSALIAAMKCDSTYQTWTDAPAANEHRPINCISWYEAMAFCVWDGGYLPTEAEWNYAATGGDQQRAYPWSAPAGSLVLDGSRASYRDGTNCVGDDTAGCQVTDLVPVGSKPQGDGRWGQSDLAGNVWERTLDWYDDYATSCTDCAVVVAPSSSDHRVVRGGCFNDILAFLRTGYRSFYGAPTQRYNNFGVRCARAP